MADDENSLLVLIVDTNPVWWGNNSTLTSQIKLSQCIDALMVFCNSHLMLSHKNQLAVIAAHQNNSRFLYPRSNAKEEAEDEMQGETVQRGEPDGKYELHARVNRCITEQLKDLILNDKSHEIHNDCLLTGAMSMALCYCHRQEKELPFGQTLQSRILIVKGAEDNPSQYMNMMNIIFTAQKMNILIDACILDNESGLLQQACDITGGIYLKIPQLQGLLQYLLWIFLPGTEMRSKLSLPARTKVDYRAACFCHRQLIDIGYVCSVCLSIFCAFSPICSTCQTTFKFMAPPKTLKRKSKKSAVS